jgi:uncharacterized protein YlxP (DUF503 family)
MVVGLCRISLAIPGNTSLKGKRSVVRRIVERARSRFNAAVAEVDDLDALQRATVGFAVVSNDRVHARRMIARVASFLEGSGLAVPLERETEVMSLGGAIAPRSMMEADADEPGDEGDDERAELDSDGDGDGDGDGDDDGGDEAP